MLIQLFPRYSARTATNKFSFSAILPEEKYELACNTHYILNVDKSKRKEFKESFFTRMDKRNNFRIEVSPLEQLTPYFGSMPYELLTVSVYNFNSEDENCKFFTEILNSLAFEEIISLNLNIFNRHIANDFRVQMIKYNSSILDRKEIISRQKMLEERLIGSFRYDEMCQQF